MEKRIIYDTSFENCLTDLIDILFYKDYFSYIENAENYVVTLKNEIENYIDIKQHYQTPKKLSRHGNHYIVVSPNNRTSWYVFFEKKDNRYLNQYSTNNHMEVANFLKLDY